jgi:ribulose-5-phosphate 4-epimerase/fuculose-1-phosphate aldolase
MHEMARQGVHVGRAGAIQPFRADARGNRPYGERCANSRPGGNAMNVQAKEPANPAAAIGKLPMPPKFANLADERLHRKQRLAAGFRLFSKFGFDEGVAGHITARDPEFPDTFWVNPFGVHFSQIKVSNLIRCDHKGNVVDGDYPVNTAAFVIHSRVHAARPDAVAAAHSHSTYGRAFATLGRPLAPITQDVCAFYNDHAVYDDFGGVVVELDEGQRIADAIGKHKAAILQNHGLITVGGTVDEAVWWFITMERSCQVQLLAEAALRGTETLKLISPQAAAQAHNITGSAFAGWFQFQPLYARIVKEQPDLLD